MSLALLTGALAQGGLEAWDIRERNAYVVMMDGKMMRVSLGDKGMTMLMKGAKRVPRGTAFIMSGGQLYMVNASQDVRPGRHAELRRRLIVQRLAAPAASPACGEKTCKATSPALTRDVAFLCHTGASFICSSTALPSRLSGLPIISAISKWL